LKIRYLYFTFSLGLWIETLNPPTNSPSVTIYTRTETNVYLHIVLVVVVVVVVVVVLFLPKLE
jgi:hypothetical protein